MQDFHKLRVWQVAHQLVLDVYDATAHFPGEEKFGLTSPLRRAAVSVPSNIAEGSARGSGADFARFLHVATGSASEVEYQLLLARDLGFLSSDSYEPLHQSTIQIRRMLLCLLRRVTQTHNP